MRESKRVDSLIYLRREDGIIRHIFCLFLEGQPPVGHGLPIH